MLNKDQLLKIKGILSAKEGAQVPKFLNPAGPLPYTVWKNLPNNKGKSMADFWKELEQTLPKQETTDPTNDLLQRTLTSSTITPTIQTVQDLAKGLQTALSKSSLQILADNLAAAISWNLAAPTVQNPLEPKADSILKPEVETPDPTVIEKSLEKQNIKEQPTSEGDTQEHSAINALTSNLTYTNSNSGTKNPTVHIDSKEEAEEKKVVVTTDNTKAGASNSTTEGSTDGTLRDLQEVKVTPGTAGGTDDTKKGTGVTVTLWGVKKPRTAEGEKVKWGNMTEELKSLYINGIGQKGGQYAAVAGTAIDATSAMLVNKDDYADDSWTNSESRNTYDAVSNTLMKTGGYGAMAGAAMKAVGLINDLGGSKTRDFSKDTTTINLVGGSYGGTVSDINSAASKAGKKYGLFESGARRDANEAIAKAVKKLNIMAGIASSAKEQSEAARNMSYQNTLNYQYQINGGFDQRYLRAAKEGGSIEYFKDPFKVTLSDINDFKVELSDTPTLFKAGGTLLDKLDNNVFKVELTDVPELEKFKEGGSIKDREIEVIETDTTLKSVIPEGALHKNKHHLNDVGVDDSELTKKGIPVVDNQGEQQAEIELNEIIFTLEVTKELESRYKEFYEEGTSSARKDELAIEAGKLLWKEILYNTDDRTGLIDTLKQGGTVKAKKNSKPDYSKWIKDVNPEFINDNYDLETAYNYLPYELLERWKTAVNSPDPDKYLNYQDPKTGEYTYHLGSVAQLDNGDYIFLKKGTEKTNPELHWETDTYYNGANGLKETHDLVYDGKEGRYFYRKRTTPKKHKEGGIIKNPDQDEITKMVRQALINILTNNG